MVQLLVTRKENGRLVAEVGGTAPDRASAVWHGWSLRCNGYMVRRRRVEGAEILNVRIRPDNGKKK